MANETTDPFRHCYMERASAAGQAYEQDKLPSGAIANRSKYELGEAGASVRVPFMLHTPVKEEVMAVANHFCQFLMGRTLNGSRVEFSRIEDASHPRAEPNEGIQYIIFLSNEPQRSVAYRVFGESTHVSICHDHAKSSIEYKHVLEEYVSNLQSL